MAQLSAELKKILARTKLVVLPEDYYMVHLPVDVKPIPGEWYRPATTRFALFIREPEEITLVIPRRKWLRIKTLFKKHKLTGPIKVITLEGKLSQHICRVMVAIGDLMSAADIKVAPLSSFTRTKLFVMKEDLPRTIRALRQLLAGCKAG